VRVPFGLVDTVSASFNHWLQQATTPALWSQRRSALTLAGMPRILFHAPPLVGHTLPMMGLACALRAKGHVVAWALGEDVQPLARRQGFEVLAVGPSRAWAMQHLLRRWPERAGLSSAQQVLELGPRLFADVYAPATLPELRLAMQAWQPDLVVHDVMAHAAPLAAALNGLPSISHGFGLPRPQTSVDSAHARMASLWQAHGQDLTADSGNHRHGHIDICPPSMRPAGPPLAAPAWLLSPASGVRRSLGPREGILASFGTVHHEQAAFEALLQTLQAGPWPTRIALGRPVEPTRHLPPHVHAVAWLDLGAEWARCRVGACHGGAGTMLGALAQGVPLLLLPVAADQFRNAQALRAVGAGLVLEGEGQTAVRMRLALQHLFEDQAFTSAAGRVAEEIADMPQAEAVAKAVAQALVPQFF
jgi:UDP:flavonoid glycosyltransferase YjiC (YdhE family)